MISEWVRQSGGGPPPSPPAVLMENSGFVLEEDGSKILLE